MKWTPFGVLRGYLHTVDDCGRESLFQAQIRRIEAFITAARDAKKTSVPSLLVIDEILNSTNPIEAMLLSYQYARIVGDDLSGTSRMAMTTHYPVLTTLANKYPDQFANWAMGPGYELGVGNACHASSAIGTVQAMGMEGEPLWLGLPPLALILGIFSGLSALPALWYLLPKP